MSLTVKQIQILTIVCQGNPEAETSEGRLCDLDEILERLERIFNWETTKQSIQFSIRALIRRGYLEKAGLEKRRGRRRVLIAPTDIALLVAGSKSVLESLAESVIRD